ncbi:MAG TPA: hypothetical protein VKE94_01740 [Gemmataceae bacterium]|nr:hypothetical protein [Gemmataceae bacterium]
MKTRFLSFVILCSLLVLGCGKSDAKSTPSAKSTTHDHDSWWCDEHGMPEEVCAQCNTKLAAQFKKQGDWCKDHDRPDSQCFVCHPDLKEKFAAQYRAKYGKEPPAMEEENGKE